MDLEEIRNPFPSPPSFYTHFTSYNLKLRDLWLERSSGNEQESQHELLSEFTDVPDWPLSSLQPPRVDWILDEGEFTVFGEVWPVKDKIPSLGQLGGTQLYPADPSTDRRPALLSILKSLLVTYSFLTSSLLAPPPTNSAAEIPPKWHRHTEWIAVLSQNILAAANDLRPVQARGNLESMMKRQLELRREETTALHSKCDALEAKLAELRVAAQMVADQTTLVSSKNTSNLNDSGVLQATPINTSIPTTGVSNDDVLRWSEGI
ncbi:MED7 protein-domain-containing protein [Mucidula mucida]|nr:MED7 protein-domain-containing protein [Mucidula mucida]